LPGNSLDPAETLGYDFDISHDVDAVYDHGVFRPLKPLLLPEGTRVHLRVEEEASAGGASVCIGQIRSPRLANPQQAADFMMQVREAPDASSMGQR
jgi:predicted DNA-binding antitoxin AbrB/MazE fold protein